MKSAYATILSSENFAAGVKRLYRGIRSFSNAEVAVFVNEDISKSTVSELEKLGLTVIKESGPVFDEGVITEKQAADRWNKTLFKFVVFKEHGYDKLVYLDSDLLIRSNIDSLFDKPEWSAVPDKEFFPEYSREGLNAGVMVITPSIKTYKMLVELTTEVSKKQVIFGDQDVVNEFLSEWDKKPELHLGGEYNSCFYSKRGGKNPKVIHFIFEDKPWMWSKKKILMKKLKWLITLQNKKIKYLNEYLRG